MKNDHAHLCWITFLDVCGTLFSLLWLHEIIQKIADDDVGTKILNPDDSINSVYRKFESGNTVSWKCNAQEIVIMNQNRITLIESL